MKLPVCPGERNLTALIRSTRQILTAPDRAPNKSLTTLVRATNTLFSAGSRPNQTTRVTSRPAQRSKTATEIYRYCSGADTRGHPVR
ncbi:hypothetical protein [Mixta mediterraneensis]|uniref:hypothetical protein n=1 Tax=Mixta mediterraneensis TaxID=2758443 RepID=UPI001874FE99|nr:hypothetical protein [Mixta mediterraneensis]MBE5252493.1 hypothetical protein [Mixta mediterraneensis]